ncbi:hypothetical protein [Candidatus Xianfuyuplasma coldseepsis]|uniref:InlB B-repeat-containing protein n=1 Tax=Candidatus Xianfuyuplasma coldseepsis TaxID=2782163 RepID=A0A7L7KPZ9_9MOLU|nr:hypothetical protein [Xianfuyuplasma coldseepsis]QMS84266.1 hypothetical protein G4Z02_00425 [Xianfuyuplasma coldseepsis]
MKKIYFVAILLVVSITLIGCESKDDFGECSVEQVYVDGSCVNREDNMKTITFLDYDERIIENIEVYTLEELQNSQYPSNPEKDGYVFIGWDVTLDEVSVYEDVTLKAIYEIGVFEISYISLEGDLLSKVSYEFGSILEYEMIPNGLCGEDYTQKVEFNLPPTMPGNDLEYTVLCELNSYSLTIFGFEDEVLYTENFSSGENHGVEIGDEFYIYYDFGTSEITLPALENHVFTGWSEMLPDIMPNYDINIYAEFIPERLITGSNLYPRDVFGRDVLVYDDYLITSAPFYLNNVGSVYVYKFSDSNYERIISNPLQDDGSHFGKSLLSINNYIVVYSDSEVYFGNEKYTRYYVYDLNDASYERIFIAKSFNTHDDYIFASEFNEITGKAELNIYKMSDEEYKRTINYDGISAKTEINAGYFYENYFVVTYKEQFNENMYIYKLDDSNYEYQIPNMQDENNNFYTPEFHNLENGYFSVADRDGVVTLRRYDDELFVKTFSVNLENEFLNGVILKGENLTVFTGGSIYMFDIMNQENVKIIPLESQMINGETIYQHYNIFDNYILVMYRYRSEYYDDFTSVDLYKFDDNSYKKSITLTYSYSDIRIEENKLIIVSGDHDTSTVFEIFDLVDESNNKTLSVSSDFLEYLRYDIYNNYLIIASYRAGAIGVVNLSSTSSDLSQDIILIAKVDGSYFGSGINTEGDYLIVHAERYNTYQGALLLYSIEDIVSNGQD